MSRSKYSALQVAVDAATSGDTLWVRSTCFGPTHIKGKDLNIVGVGGAARLDGADTSRVLTIGKRTSVVLRDLVITHGHAGIWGGGGIWIGPNATAVLSGSTTVTNNRMTGDWTVGAGISVRGGTLVMNDSSSVADACQTPVSVDVYTTRSGRSSARSGMPTTGARNRRSQVGSSMTGHAIPRPAE
jgi:hypothetical protein